VQDEQNKGGFTPDQMIALRKLFYESGSGYLDLFLEELDKIESQDRSDAVLETLHRSIHSLKGAALQLDYLPAGNLALAMERMVKQIRDSDCESSSMSEVVSLLREGEKRIRLYLDNIIKDEEMDESPVDLLRRFKILADKLISGNDQETAI